MSQQERLALAGLLAYVCALSALSTYLSLAIT